MHLHLSLAIACALALVACDGDPAPDPNDPTRRNLLVSFADGFYVPALDALVSRTAALEEATAAYAGSLSEADRLAAQQQWGRAMETVQRLEEAQVGPAGLTFGVAGGTQGGEERRTDIYSWPAHNPCRIDQETVGPAHADAAQLAATDALARGLDAIEYLLFADTEANQCSTLSAINAEGTWDALAAEVPQRRATYAHTSAELVRAEAAALRARWTEGDAFRAQLVSAGDGSDAYATANQAVSAIFGALLYVDTMVKDMKIGLPAGLVDGCSAASCPEARESLHADASVAHIGANLEAIDAIWHGPADGTGFDDLLVAVGGAELAQRIDQAIAAARTEVAALNGPLPDLLAANGDALLPLFTAVKNLSDLLKTEAATALDIHLVSVPMDND